MKETAKESEAHLSLQEEEAKKAEQEAAKQEEKRWRHTYSDRPGLVEALSASTMPELTLQHSAHVILVDMSTRRKSL